MKHISMVVWQCVVLWLQLGERYTYICIRTDAYTYDMHHRTYRRLMGICMYYYATPYYFPQCMYI